RLGRGLRRGRLAGRRRAGRRRRQEVGRPGRRHRDRHRRAGRRHRPGASRPGRPRRHRPQPQRRRQAVHAHDLGPRLRRVPRDLRAPHRLHPRDQVMVRWALLCAGLAACGPKPSATPHAMTTPHETFLASCRAELAEARTDISAIKSAGKRTVETVLVPYDRVLTVVDRWSSRATLFSEVHPDARMREAAEACVKDTAAFQAEYKLDRALHDAIAAVPAAPHEDPETQRFLERTLRDFRRAGVDKDEAARARLKALNDEITAVQLDFAKNIREDVHRVKLDPAELAGMPADYIDAHKPGADGKVEITTDYPDFYPFMQYAESGAARKRLYLEFLNRGYPKNGPVLKQLLAARKEFATILGYRNWADYITEDKM